MGLEPPLPSPVLVVAVVCAEVGIVWLWLLEKRLLVGDIGNGCVVCGAALEAVDEEEMGGGGVFGAVGLVPDCVKGCEKLDSVVLGVLLVLPVDEAALESGDLETGCVIDQDELDPILSLKQMGVRSPWNHSLSSWQLKTCPRC